jgi:succinate-acetate transporter protein
MIFTSLLLGFVLLDLEKFVSPLFLAPAAWTLIFCAASALYGMAHVVLLDVYGRDMLPMGPALVR